MLESERMTKSEGRASSGLPADHEEEEAELQPAVQAIIGQHLKTYYEDLVQAPIPDTILLLLAQLEAKETEIGQ